MFREDLLAGKRILITGGGTGLGRAMGERFLELGASLVICGRRGDVLDAARRIPGRPVVPPLTQASRPGGGRGTGAGRR